MSFSGQPMPGWQQQPDNKLYKRELSDLRIALPQWWPARPHTDVVGGDLDARAVIVHLPFEGNPYLARLPADGSLPGNTAATLNELQQGRWAFEWTDTEWRWVIFSRVELTTAEIDRIRQSMSDANPSRKTHPGRSS